MHALIWLQFFICLAAILFAGTRLAKYADVIAEKSRLGRIWIGLALVAMITATPEMATGISAATLVDSPDLAMGTLIGSCCFNLALIALLDIANRKRPVLAQASVRHLPGVRWGFLLLCIAIASLYFAPRFPAVLLGWMSLGSLLLVGTYVYAMRRILRAERGQEPTQHSNVSRYGTLTLRGALLRFCMAAAMVIGAGIWLSLVGDQIATITGWGSSFVGNLLLAAATSAPELIVCISAVRMGFRDIALADILGANMLDTGMLGLVDAVYLRGSLFAGASQVNLAAMICAALMVGIVGIAIWRGTSRYLFWRISWYGPILIGLYVAAAYVLFTFGTA